MVSKQSISSHLSYSKLICCKIDDLYLQFNEQYVTISKEVCLQRHFFNIRYRKTKRIKLTFRSFTIILFIHFYYNPIQFIFEALFQTQPSCSQSKKKRNEKENINHATSVSKFKQESGKKQKKKKFLQGQVQKIMQKRRVDSGSKKRSFKENSKQELMDMKEDLQQIKEVVTKLAFDEKTNKKQSKKAENDGELQMICLGYRRKISQIQEELNVQKMANAQLQEAHIQSQVFAQQTKDFSESIKQELQELASKHIKCQENARQLEEARRAIRILDIKNDQLDKMVQDYQINDQQRISEVQMIRNNLNEVNKENQQLRLSLQSVVNQSSLKQENLGLKEKVKQLQQQRQSLRKYFQKKEKQLNIQISNLQKLYKQLIDQKDIISYTFLEKIDLAQLNLKKVTDQNDKMRQQNDRLIKQLQNQTKKIEKERKSLTKINSLKIQLKNTQIQMNKPSQIVDVGGLASMQQKCSQLYQQIRKEKLKWDLLNSQTNEQKKNLETQLQHLATERQSINIQLKSYQCSLGQSLKISQRLRTQKHNQEIQIKKLKNDIVAHKDQKQSLILQLKCQYDKQKDNQTELLAYKRKTQELQQKLKTIEEKKEALLVFKNSHIIAVKAFDRQTSDLKSQICRLEQNKKKLDSQIKQLNHLLQNKSLDLNDVITHNSNIQQQKKVVQTDLKKTNEAHKNALKKNEQLTLQLTKLNEQLTEIMQTAERQDKIKQQKYSILQTQLQTLRDQYACCQNKLAQSTESRSQLQEQLRKLTDSTKRNSSQLQLYEKQINLKNKNIFELKKTIKLVKEQSIRIKEQVQIYQEEFRMMNEKILANEDAKKFQDLTAIVQKQIDYMKEKIDGVNFDKEDIQIQMRKIMDENTQLQQKIKIIQNGHQNYDHQSQYSAIIQKIQESLVQQLKNSQNKQYQINCLQENIQAKQEKISELKHQIQSYLNKINQLSVANSKINKNLQQKDKIIIQPKQSYSISNEERNQKVAQQIKTLQNQIKLLDQEKILLGSENKLLKNKLNDSLISICNYQQKIEILMENQKALQQQKQAFEQQLQIFKLGTARSKQSLTQIQQKKLKQLREIYKNYQIRSIEETNTLKESIVTLKETIKQLANELTNSIDKLNAKNEQIQKIKVKYGEIQSVLKENHELLDQQREQRQKISALNSQLNLCIENYKLQIISKGKQAESLTKQKSILKSKLVELQSKYEILREKYEATEKQKLQAKKQIENQSVTLRVLREQNKNIQKVMSDQLNQRKAIIEQLVNQKKILYQQLKN